MKLIFSLFITLLVIFNTQAQSNSKSKSHFFKNPSALQRQQGTFIYDLATSMEPYVELTGATSINNGEIWDDPEYVINLPFEFLLNETIVTSLQFFGLGALFEAPTGVPDVYTNIFPFEVDLLDRGELEGLESLSPISYKVDGNPGSRIYKLEYKNAGSYAEYAEMNTMDMYINFQMWLYEETNMIQFRFGPSSIDDPALFYEDLSGAFIGTGDYDEANDILFNGHFITGDAANPSMSAQFFPIDGTPADGMVYTLYISTPITIDIAAEQVTSYCAPNGSLEANVSGGVPAYTYAWSNGGNTPVIQNLAQGTYTLTVTDATGATATASETISSTVDPMTLVITVTHESGAGANDGTATVEASEGLPPYTYLWSNGETTAIIEDLAPGIYTVTVTDNIGCSEVAEAVVNPFGCPQLLMEAAITNLSCFGLCDGNVSIVEVINGTPPFTYEWSNGGSEESINDVCAGTYSVTITDNNNCIVSADWTVFEPSALNANASSTNESLLGANDGTATANSFGGTPSYTYLWSNGGNTQQITGLAPGAYSVIVTDTNGCTANDTVTVEAGPCALLLANTSNVTCNGACDGSIEINGVWASILWSTGSTGNSLNDLCAGDYGVTVTDGFGCTIEATFTIAEPQPLVINTGSTNETQQGGDGTAWVIPSGGTAPYTYLWSNGSTDSLLTNLVADTFSVIVTDVNSCMDTAEVVVNPFVCFILTLNEVQHVFCHDSCDGLIFVVPLGGVGPYDYAWSFGDTSNIVFDLCEGFYGVTVTDLGQNGCTVSAEVEILQPDSFYITFDEVVHLTDTSVASIQVSFHGGTPPYTPLWFGPNGFISFEEDLEDVEPGLYILNMFDGFDCSLTDTVEILDLTTSLPQLPEDAIHIFPNPATSDLQIESRLNGDYSIELYSILGIRMAAWYNARTIDISMFRSGMYLVKFENEAGYFVKRVMIETGQ